MSVAIPSSTYTSSLKLFGKIFVLTAGSITSGLIIYDAFKYLSNKLRILCMPITEKLIEKIGYETYSNCEFVLIYSCVISPFIYLIRTTVAK